MVRLRKAKEKSSCAVTRESCLKINLYLPWDNKWDKLQFDIATRLTLQRSSSVLDRSISPQVKIPVPQANVTRRGVEALVCPSDWGVNKTLRSDVESERENER